MVTTVKKNNTQGLQAQSPLAVKVINLKAHQDNLRWRRGYWAQTTDFTCGPSCLLMAAQLLGVKRQFRQVDEYLIWRRANTLFMGDEGQAGCSPEGLGLAAMRLGLKAKIYQHDVVDLFVEDCYSSTTKIKKRHEKLRIMQEVILDDRRHYLQMGGEMSHAMPNAKVLHQHMQAGEVLMCLVNEYDADGSHVLHWVLAVQAGGDEVTVMNPWNQESPDYVRLERFKIDAFLKEISHGEDGQGAVVAFSL